MANKIRFTKMHGAGNDYIYVDTTKYSIPNPNATSIKWSQYHKGIGSDGLVLIGRSDKADFSMRIFNADGSEAMMCGNASRCIGKYVYENKLTQKDEITLDTLSGIKKIKLNICNDKVNSVTVDMGEPAIRCKSQIATENGEMINGIIEIDGNKYHSTFVSMGNPHLVIFVNDIKKVNLQNIGPKIENNPLFPERVNVEFVEVLEDKSLRMRVWERGSGITMACGTGACASIVAANLNRYSLRENLVIMDGGNLVINWNKDDNHVYMTGEAVKVFEGEIEL